MFVMCGETMYYKRSLTVASLKHTILNGGNVAAKEMLFSVLVESKCCVERMIRKK
jgi:hypothetical protein